jgi:hypothetical protein
MFASFFRLALGTPLADLMVGRFAAAVFVLLRKFTCNITPQSLPKLQKAYFAMLNQATTDHMSYFCSLDTAAFSM